MTYGQYGAPQSRANGNVPDNGREPKVVLLNSVGTKKETGHGTPR